MEQTPDLAKLSRLAQTEDGKKLLRLLQKGGGNRLQAAAAQASQGNYDGAKALLSSLLSSDEAQALLKKLEDQV